MDCETWNAVYGIKCVLDASVVVYVGEICQGQFQKELFKEHLFQIVTYIQEIKSVCRTLLTSRITVHYRTSRNSSILETGQLVPIQVKITIPSKSENFSASSSISKHSYASWFKQEIAAWCTYGKRLLTWKPPLLIETLFPIDDVKSVKAQQFLQLAACSVTSDSNIFTTVKSQLHPDCVWKRWCHFVLLTMWSQ